MRQLAGEFDVSINTIQRDITYLARYYPLETAYGRYGGGVYFEQNWQPYRIYMTPLHRHQQRMLFRCRKYSKPLLESSGRPPQGL